MWAEVTDLHRQRQFGTLLRLSPQAIVILDADGVIREWNPAAVELLGWMREELVGEPLTRILGSAGRAAFGRIWTELRAKRAASPLHGDGLHHDNRAVPVEILLAPIQDSDGSFAGVVGTLSCSVPMPRRADSVGVADAISISAEQPPSVWDVDEITGLPGRRWLQRRLLSEIATGLVRAVAVLDIDGFALVNQDYGVEVGDQVLGELAARLKARCAPAAVGRWQADEFLLVLDAASAEEDLLALLETAAVEAKQPLSVGGDEIRLTFSAGVSATTAVGVPALFRSATTAMFEAKARGRDITVRFDERSMSTSPSPGLRLANDLQRGIANDELQLHFQPIVHLATNDVVGVEALVRWVKPGVGLLAPAAFIPVAEQTGQIVALGGWVARHACDAAVAFAADQPAPLTVSVNVSARQLNDPGLLAMLRAACRDSGCDPSRIVVEVTETALLQDMAAVAAVLEEIRELGMDVDLDDFGTGYSSLLYLKHLPVSRIKIDREFVAGLGTDLTDTAIVTSTIALSHSMGIAAVAEGVETPEQLGLLRQLGCDYAQGYLICRPVPRDELTTWLGRQLPSRLVHRAPPEGAPDTGTASRQDLRDDTADGRDEAGDRRDLAGDVRDSAADDRDVAGDERDRERDRRDALADRRDEIADEREAARGGNPNELAAQTSEVDGAHARSRGERSSLIVEQSDRVQAADDRAAAAVRRGEAQVERDVAEADRIVQSQERAGDASDVGPDAASSPDHDAERSVTFDALTGAYLWNAGQAAVDSEIEAARRQGESLNVVHVSLAEGDSGEQLARDSELVVVTNILGHALQPRDLLVRKGATELVCVVRGLDADEFESWLSHVERSLAAGANLAMPAIVRTAVLTRDDDAQTVLSRAETSVRRGP